MNSTSVWRDGVPAGDFAPLDQVSATDVLVIGGGITGVTLAWLLASQGRAVTLLEAGTLGSGTTGHSTGNLYETLSHGLSEIAVAWDREMARTVLERRREAIAFVERIAAGAHEVGFQRCDLVRYAQSAQHQEAIQHEGRALADAGAVVRWLPDVALGHHLPPAAGAALVLPGQAQFQPQAWLRHLARQAAKAGARLHEHSPVVELDTSVRIAHTPRGNVRAQEIVMATHTPKGIRLVHAEMPVHREYGVALPLAEGDPGPGIFWAKGEESLSVRTHRHGTVGHLVCVGWEHVAGQHDAQAAQQALEAAARRHFGERAVTHRWSAQNYRSADALPYIGHDAAGLYLATGFAADGLTWGTVAAHLLAGLLRGERDDFAHACRPTRLSPVKGGKAILEEVGITARALVRDYLTHPQHEQLAALAPGQGAIVEAEGRSCAAWRSPQGELFTVSSACTHMGCKVHWNGAETSWDCPCHGSRFRPDGSVIEGPAVAPLARLHTPPDTVAPQPPGTASP